MLYSLNITKSYAVDKPLDEVFTHLDKIISEPFSNSTYTMFGNFASADPPEFLFMSKGFSMRRPMFAEMASTKVFATLVKEDDKAKITITTKTNPTFVFWFIFLLTIALIKLITLNNGTAIEMALTYLVLAILVIPLDRFIKNMAIAGFETDCIKKLSK